MEKSDWGRLVKREKEISKKEKRFLSEESSDGEESVSSLYKKSYFLKGKWPRDEKEKKMLTEEKKDKSTDKKRKEKIMKSIDKKNNEKWRKCRERIKYMYKEV